MRRNLPVLPFDAAPMKLTHSEMACFRDCPRRWGYRYLMRRAARRVAHALWFGNAVHLCLETYWNARKHSNARLGDESHLNAGLAAIPQDASEYDAVRMRVMLAAYAAMWNPKPGRVLHTELPFDLPLINPATGEEHALFRRAGKIDLVLGYAQGAAIVEHKTKGSKVDESYTRRLRVDEQISHYTAACDAMGMPVLKIVYDVLLKPDLEPQSATPVEKRKWTKPTKQNPEPRLYEGQRLENETMEAFKERLLAKWMEEPSKYIFQIPVERTQGDRHEWEYEVWDQAELMRFCAENGHFPKNSRSCSNHFGSYCDYLPVCEGTADIHDDSRYALLPDAHPELATEGLIR